MIIAIHQPNLAPWMPYFQKIAQADIFVIQCHCQYEKNGFQNRCKVNDKWWTRPITKGEAPIYCKRYVDGQRLIDVNIPIIFAISRLLGINTDKIKLDFPTDKKKTDRIIEICKHFGCDEYLTNPDATDKYLDEKLLNENGIKLIPFRSKRRKHVFELIDEFGLEKVMQMVYEKV